MAIQFLSSITITGSTSVSSIANDNSTYTGILVWDGGALKYRTKSQLLSDIGGTGNTGTVTSVTVQGNTGLSGSGTITTSGTITLTNSDRGSSQAIYKNIASDSGTATANSNNDTLTIAGGTNVTTARSGDTITITSQDTTTNNFVTGLSWATGTGVLSATRSGLSTLTVDLDGRYVTSSGVTSVATGTGLSGGTITSTGTITNTDRGSSQSIFKNVAVSGQNTVVADNNNDTLTFVGAGGMTITTDNTTDTITFNPNDNNDNNFVTGASQSGGTLTLTRQGLSSLTATGFTNASNTQTFTNKSGNISQWSNNSGYITSASLPTVSNATITVTTAAGLQGATSFTLNQSSSASIALALNFNGLGASGTLVGTDDIVVVDGTSSKKTQISTIPLSIFNNNAGFTTNTGTVTSVAQSHTGNAFDVGGSPITGSGTLAIDVVGSSAQYINGLGNLITFPSIPQGDITAVVAGTGLSGGGTSGSVTLNNTITNNNQLTNGAGYITSGSLQGVPAILSNGTVPSLNTGISAVEVRSLIGAGTSSSAGVTSVATGSGLTGGTITSSGTLSHSDTSSQSSVNNSGVTYIQDVSLDGFGHVTSLTSSTATLSGLGYTGATDANKITNNNQITNGAGYITSGSLPTVSNATITLTAGTGLTGGGTITLNQSSNETVTFNNSITNNNQLSNGAGYVTSSGVTAVNSGNTNTLSKSGSTTTTLTPNTGTVNSSSSNLATGAQIQTAINTAVTGVLKYDGVWNASTNSPTLSSGSGTTGEYYIVSVAGSTNLDGITDWAVGDWAVFSDLATDSWQKIDNTQVGNVTGSGSSGRVTYWNGASNITSDAGFTFNGGSNALTVTGVMNWNGGSSIESNSAYDNMITGFGNSGSSSKTLTLTQQDGGTLTTNFSIPQGTVTSVGFSHGGNAFTTGGAPVTSNGTIAITMAGSSSQYINGAGNLTSFPSIPQGDITAVNAGTGMSGGGTSGSVTLNCTITNNNQLTNGAGYSTTTGTVTTSGTINTNEFAQFASSSAIKALTAAEMRTALNVPNTTAVITNNNQLTNGRGFTTNTGTTTASNSQTFSNKGGNISQWTNDSGYVTSSGGSMSSWILKEGNGTETSTVTNGETVTFAQGSGIQTELTSTSSGGTLTITNTRTVISNNNQLTNGAGYTTNTGTTTASNSQTFTNKGGNISQWTNNSGYTTNVGDITGVTAGTGMSGGGSSGSVTLNCTVPVISNNNQLTNGAGYTTNTGTMTGFGVAAAVGGSSFTISNGETLSLVGGTNITASFNSSNESITFNNDITNNNQLTNGAGYVTSSGGSMSSWSLTADSGGSETITNGESVDIAGGTNITTARSGSTVTINNGITNNNQLSNGAGYTTSVGDITSVAAGTGMSGGGTSGAVTLNCTVPVISNNNQLTNGAGYTTAVGDITNVSAGAGLSGGGGSGSVSVAVDYLGTDNVVLSSPTNATGTLSSSDNILVSNGSNNAVKAAISLLPFTNNSGDITNVSAGTGMSGGGSSGSVTLNCTVPVISNNNQLTNGAGYTTSVGDITAVSAGSGLTGGGTSGAVTVNVDYSGSDSIIMAAPGGSTPDGDDYLIYGADSSGGGETNKVQITDFAVSNFDFDISTVNNWTVNSTLNVRGAIDLADNDILRFGSGDDVEMSFSGSDMFMDINNGEDFKIRDGNSGNATRFTFDADGGNFTASGNVTAYSDERLKDNVETLDGSKVLDMRGVSYTKDGKAGSGVIAQELEKIAPELVMTDDKEDGIKSVAYGNLVGYLIEAVKEQQKQIDELKMKLDDISK